MNITTLNMTTLDGGVIIKKGEGGGGVTINNQDKVVDITENGTTEVVADSGFTGLGKVTINTEVEGNTSGMPVIGDGKSYLYIKIAAEGRMNVPLYFSQTVANGITIDWGDGSEPQTLSGTGNVGTTHTYAEIGEYCISLNPASGCTLELGHNSPNYSVMGRISDSGIVYCNMLQAVELGGSVISIGKYTFRNCYSLSRIIIPDSVTSIKASAFADCYSLSRIIIPDSVTSIGGAFTNCYSLSSIVIPYGTTSIGNSAFNNCYALSSIVIPGGVTSIKSSAFYNCCALSSIVIPGGVTSIENKAFGYCYGMAFIDFSQCTSVPTLGGTVAFISLPSDCKIIVPDNLYDEWIAATNWSTHASNIVKASEFNG